MTRRHRLMTANRPTSRSSSCNIAWDTLASSRSRDRSPSSSVPLPPPPCGARSSAGRATTGRNLSSRPFYRLPPSASPLPPSPRPSCAPRPPHTVPPHQRTHIVAATTRARMGSSSPAATTHSSPAPHASCHACASQSPPHVDNLLVTYAAAAVAFCLNESGYAPYMLATCG